MTILRKLFGQSGNVTFCKTQRQSDGNTYDIYKATSRSDALSFLRQHEVREERRYAIVETPQGNFGKDFIMIFDERTKDMIEMATRARLRTPKISRTRCCQCGFPVIPLDASLDNGASVGAVREFVIVFEMKKQGTGFTCSRCNALSCAICLPSGDKTKCPLCRAPMIPYQLHE